MSEPEGVELSARARAVLRAARHGDPRPEAVAALRRKVVPPPRGGGGSIALGGAALAALVAAAFVAWPSTPPTDALRARPITPAPAAPAAPVVSPAAPAAQIEIEPEPVVPPPAEVPETRRPAAPAIDEAAYVESIRRALDGQPDRALRLARRFPSLYPDGLLAEEAAALEVEAIARNGQHEAAQARAESFYARYPRTPYRRRLERALSESSPPE